MKKLFTLVVLSLCSLFLAPCSNAQGNLQFNRVVNTIVNFNIGTCCQSVATITVPAGKVWKIETVSYTRVLTVNNFSPASSSLDGVWIGDHIVWDNYSATRNYFPLWLSSGNYSVNAVQQVISDNKRITISAIEFNVVP